MYDPLILIWLDKTGYDCRNTIRKYIYSIRGMPSPTSCKRCEILRHVQGGAPWRVHSRRKYEWPTIFWICGKHYFLIYLLPFNIDPQSVVIMGNASVHHVQEVSDLVETQAGAGLHYLPQYSPDLKNPAKGGQIYHETRQSQTCSAPHTHVWNGQQTRLCRTYFTLWWLNQVECTVIVSVLHCFTSYFVFNLFKVSITACLSEIKTESIKFFSSASCRLLWQDNLRLWLLYQVLEIAVTLYHWQTLPS